MTASKSTQAHWAATKRLTSVLLFVWFVVSFGWLVFARELAQITLFGWPLPFYAAAQGAPLIYVLIVGVYAWQMRRLDRRHGLNGDSR